MIREWRNPPRTRTASTRRDRTGARKGHAEVHLWRGISDDDAVRARAMRQQISGLARQAAMDPGDGLKLSSRRCGPSIPFACRRIWQDNWPITLVASVSHRRLSSKPRSRRTYRLIIPNGWKRLLAVGSIVLTRQVERLERHVTISNEALALFVRFWLTVTPPLPDTAQPAAQAKGRERLRRFVEAWDGGLAKGQTCPGGFSEVISKRGAPDHTGALHEWLRRCQVFLR